MTIEDLDTAGYRPTPEARVSLGGFSKFLMLVAGAGILVFVSDRFIGDARTRYMLWIGTGAAVMIQSIQTILSPDRREDVITPDDRRKARVYGILGIIAATVIAVCGLQKLWETLS